jgi:Isoamylase 1-3, C-terminal
LPDGFCERKKPSCSAAAWNNCSGSKDLMHGVRVGHPDWSNHSRSLALSLESKNGNLRFHAVFNAYWEPPDFELPLIDGEDGDSWRRWIDTTLESPIDIVEWQKAPPVEGRTYRAGPRSVVVLLANSGGGPETCSNSSSNRCEHDSRHLIPPLLLLSVAPFSPAAYGKWGKREDGTEGWS